MNTIRRNKQTRHSSQIQQPNARGGATPTPTAQAAGAAISTAILASYAAARERDTGRNITLIEDDLPSETQILEAIQSNILPDGSIDIDAVASQLLAPNTATYARNIPLIQQTIDTSMENIQSSVPAMTKARYYTLKRAAEKALISRGLAAERAGTPAHEDSACQALNKLWRETLDAMSREESLIRDKLNTERLAEQKRIARRRDEAIANNDTAAAADAQSQMDAIRKANDAGAFK